MAAPLVSPVPKTSTFLYMYSAEENRLSLELQRGPAGLGEAQNSGGCISAAHATLSLKSQRDKLPSGFILEPRPRI